MIRTNWATRFHSALWPIPATVRIVSLSGGERLAEVPVVSAEFKDVGVRTVLEVKTEEPGDFSIYRLHINDARVDRFFNNVEFSFKQACPSELDCKP